MELEVDDEYEDVEYNDWLSELFDVYDLIWYTRFFFIRNVNGGFIKNSDILGIKCRLKQLTRIGIMAESMFLPLESFPFL